MFKPACRCISSNNVNRTQKHYIFRFNLVNIETMYNPGLSKVNSSILYYVSLHENLIQ